MKMIIKPRGRGKTTELIKRSSMTKYPIITTTLFKCDYITDLAADMGLEIPDPIPLCWIIKERALCIDNSRMAKGVYVDDLDELLGALFGAPVIAATMTDKGGDCDDGTAEK